MLTDGRESSTPLTKLDHRRRERLMLAMAERQGGVVSVKQFRMLGYRSAAVRMRVKAGRLHRLHQGVYAVGRLDVPVKGLRMAAVLACGDGALLSHAAAAAHLGLRDSSASVLDVTIPRRSSLKRSGIRIHRRLTLINEDRTVVDEVPCTSVARTLLDLSSFLDDRGVEKAVEQAEILELYDQRAIERLLRRMRGQPGSRRLTRVVGLARPGTTVAASDLEETMLALCRRCGFPQPIVNHEMLLGGERAKVDFFWPRERVVVETDSYKYHRTKAAFERDRRRDRLLELAGFGHARFTDADFDGDPAAIERQLGALLASPNAR